MKSQGERTTGESRHFGLHKNPSTPKSQRKDVKNSEITENSTVSCCERARAEAKHDIGEYNEYLILTLSLNVIAVLHVLTQSFRYFFNR